VNGCTALPLGIGGVLARGSIRQTVRKGRHYRGNQHAEAFVAGLKVSVPLMMDSPIRVLVAKPGLDGHDRGAKIIAKALRDAGMEVVYTGLRQTPEMIVNAALEEDVQVIGLSILSGAHNAIVPRVMALLNEKEMTDVVVIVGGIVPDEDAAELKRQGVAAVFQPGAPLESIVEFIRSSVKQAA
jgi:methylmalonyl-CoA mutase, C-terminal domain